MLVACYLVSGDLGYYGATGPQLWTAAGLTALWMAVVGCAVAAGFAFVAWRAARTAPVADPADDVTTEAPDAAAAETDEAATDSEREPITDPEIVDAEVVEDESQDSAPGEAAEEPEEEQKEEDTPADEIAEEDAPFIALLSLFSRFVFRLLRYFVAVSYTHLTLPTICSV